MGESGDGVEGGRDGDHVGASQGEFSVQLGKANVEADREAEREAVELSDDDFSPGAMTSDSRWTIAPGTLTSKR